MLNSDTVDTIIHFVDQEIIKYMIPYKKGNTILIGNYAVRQSKDMYLIFDCTSNKMVDQTFSRAAAIALAKSLHNKINLSYKIHRLDDILQKNYTDAIFYKNVIKNSTSNTVIAIREARLQLALEKTQSAYSDLEQFVLSDHK
jgi:hypothetical protein